MTTSLLSKLAQELMDQISSYLTQQDKFSLARTHRAIHAALIPSLYSDVCLTLLSSAWYDEKQTLAFVSKITSLLRALVKNPAYASHVTNAIFRIEYDKIIHDKRSRPIEHSFCLPSDDRAMVEHAMVDAGFSDSFQWEDGSASWATGALLALIVALCNNVKSLVIDHRLLGPSDDWFIHVLRHAVASPSHPRQGQRFDKLSRLTVLGSTEWRYLLPPGFAMLPFYLTALAELEIYQVADILEHQKPGWTFVALPWPLESPAVPHQLTTLRLKDTGAAEKTIEAILQSTPNLVTLVCEFLIPSTRSVLNMDRIAKGLSHVSHSLQNLDISCDWFADESCEVEHMTGVLNGSLRTLPTFTALLELNISPFLLFGEVSPEVAPPLAQLLPPNLTNLTLKDCLRDYWPFHAWAREDGLFASLRAFLASNYGDQSWRTTVPGLQWVVLDMVIPTSVDWLKELRESCEAEGLGVSY